jgi:hypothetical protein
LSSRFISFRKINSEPEQTKSPNPRKRRRMMMMMIRYDKFTYLLHGAGYYLKT